MRSRLNHVKAFFQWLSREPGYKSKIFYSDADYFNLSANDTRIATAKREKPVPSAEQIRHVLKSMNAETDIGKRDRALVAFAFLTGIRDDALASLSIDHIDLEKRRVFQDARDVRTKNRKTIYSCLFPVGEDVEEIVRDWVDFLKTELLFGPSDPLFPSTEVGLTDKGVFGALGLSRAHWSNAGPIRKLFRQAFESAGLPYFNPHSFRKTISLIGERTCRTPEEFKAWSQNLGHEHVLTTFTSYGAVSSHRQAEILERLCEKSGQDTCQTGVPDAATIQSVLRHLTEQSG